MPYPAFMRTAYHAIHPLIGACHPLAVRRKVRLAWSRHSARPFVDSLPGLTRKMWLGAGEYFSYYYSTQQVFEPGVLTFLGRTLRPGMTVYDVGANVGYITLFCAGLVGPLGRVIAFEPGRCAYERLLANVRLNRFTNVVARQVALSDKDGPEIYCQAIHRAEDVYNSLLSVNTPWASSGNFRETSIVVSRLDTLIKSENWPVPDLVKIDVEGAEKKVLDGMREILHLRRPLTLVLECCSMHCEKFGYTIRELVENLENQGFECRSIARTGDLPLMDLKDASWAGGMVAAMRR